MDQDVMKRAAAEDKMNEDEENTLPGFRFHPTEEELVGFYLRRKVERKPLKIELISQVDIYKYDPWDLPVPKVCSVGEKEYYFFCLRGRKYRNSTRPNRVTVNGFWKATGIDKNIYSSSSSSSSSSNNRGTTGECIGLKKSLVYYKGRAGKGTKTDWMMHELRLPPTWKGSNHQQLNLISNPQEAEDWALCKIFKRKTTTSLKICKPQSRKPSNNKESSLEYEIISDQFANFEALDDPRQQQETRINSDDATRAMHRNHTHPSCQQTSSSLAAQSSYSTSDSNLMMNLNGEEFFRDGRWDELSNPPIFFGYYS